MKEAYLYKNLGGNKAQCQTCSHYCVLTNNKRGKCGVRINEKGKIFSLVYDLPCAINIDPIEKKPFFHFLPASQSLSIATVGCNFSCKNCQNWSISQSPKNSKNFETQLGREQLSSTEVVGMAKKHNLPSISCTYTEPTVFLEYALDIMKLAKKDGLKNAWVTNGFLSKEALGLISPYLDAANVDLKSFSDDFYKENCGGRVRPILENLKTMKKNKIWLEITTLIIPTLNDDEKNFKQIADFIVSQLGPETPWHVTQFCGAISWKLQDLADTPIETLEKAHKIGKEAGLKYVYTGNVPGLLAEDTYCPKCKERMIERTGYSVQRYDKNGKCAKCGEDLNIMS